MPADGIGVPRDAESRPVRPIHWILLGLIVLSALALRLHDLTRYALWADEILTLESSAGHGLEQWQLRNTGLIEGPDLISLDNAGPFWRVFTAMARDDKHPPLYFATLRVWRSTIGDSDYALRLFSVIFSVIAVGLLFFAAQPLHGPVVALWASAIMAVSMPQIHYAQEVRAYSMLLAFVVGACVAIVRMEKYGPTRLRAAALSLCVLGMMLTHYYAATVALSLAIYAGVRFRGPTLRLAILAFASAAAVYLITWGPLLWQQMHNLDANNWWLLDFKPHHTWRTIKRALVLPARFLVEPRLSAESAAAFSGILYVVPAFLLRRRPELLLWWLLVITTPLPSLIHDFHRPGRQLEFIRYVLPAAPATYILIAAIVPPSRRVLANLLPAAAVLTCVLDLPATYAETETPKPDWRPVGQFIDTHAQDGDVMIFFGHDERDPGFTGFFYIAFDRYSKKLPMPVMFKPDRLTAQELAVLRQKPGIWLVTPDNVTVPPELLPGFAAGPSISRHMIPGVQRYVPIAQPSTARSNNPATQPIERPPETIVPSP